LAGSSQWHSLGFSSHLVLLRGRTVRLGLLDLRPIGVDEQIVVEVRLFVAGRLVLGLEAVPGLLLGVFRRLVVGGVVERPQPLLKRSMQVQRNVKI
jgi:hypothetical protein